MKYCLIFIGVLVMMKVQAQNLAASSAKDFAVIQGHVKNSVDNFWEFAQTGYIGNSLVAVTIDKNGDFSKRIPINTDADDLFLYLNESAITIFIQKNDTIIINWDAKDFDKTFSIKSSRFDRNHDLQSLLTLDTLYQKPYFELEQSLWSDKLTDSLKFSKINDLYNKEMNTLLADEVYDGTQKIATDIYYKYASMLLKHRLLPVYDLYIQKPSENSSFVPIITAKKFYKTESNANFRISTSYRNFLFDYLRFYDRPIDNWIISGADAEDKSVPFAPAWSDYYAGLINFKIYELRDWFITQSIIFDFEHYSFDDASAIYHDFIAKVKTPYCADTLKIFYSNVQRLKPGTPAPSFTLNNEKGKAVSLSDLKGKVVYLDFWGVHCGPCISDIKNYFPALHERYKNRNIVFVNICVDVNASEWGRNLTKLNLDGINLLAEGWTTNPVCNLYGINGIPHYYLIDTNGKIVDNNAPQPSNPNLHAALDKLLDK